MRDRCAVPRTFLRCVRTWRRNCCIGQLSPFSEYALRLVSFPVNNPATPKSWDCSQRSRWYDLIRQCNAAVFLKLAPHAVHVGLFIHSTNRITLRRFVRSSACTTSFLSSSISKRSTVRIASCGPGSINSLRMRLPSSMARMSMRMSWSGLFISVRNFLDAANLPNWRADHWQSNQRCRHSPSGYSGGVAPIRVSVGLYFTTRNP